MNAWRRLLDGHLGLDLAAPLDEPVIASADGVVSHAGPIQGPTVLVSLCVKLNHPSFGFQTIYCHLSKTPVTRGASVKRGDVVGFVGFPAIATVAIHLHFGLWPIAAGEWKTIQGFIDPSPFIAGCFDPKHTYPADRFVLTYPLKC
jgi:murein DD-endopeptidase MepM/ murein hydrolase activator NlpD